MQYFLLGLAITMGLAGLVFVVHHYLAYKRTRF